MTPLKAVSWIVGSIYLIVGGSFKTVQLYREYQELRASSAYYLCRIMQTGPQKEALKTTYLAELMRISANHPVPYDEFDTDLAHKQLMASPLIREASVKLLGHDTIFVDYTIRQPIGWLYDYENTAFDEEGVPFPISPFFSPKKLPEIYLGIASIQFGKPLADRKIQLALTLLKLLEQLPLQTKRIDVSKAFVESLGQREIVMVLDEQGFTKYLRLTPKNFSQELGNFLELRKSLTPTQQVIDLRIPQLAYIEDKQ